MSVVMNLYRLNTEVRYKGYHLDFVTSKDFEENEHGISKVDLIEQELGCPDEKDNMHYSGWLAEQENSAWTDNKKHYFFSYSLYNSMFKKYRSWRRLNNRIKNLPYMLFDNGRFVQKYLCLDEVEHAQGWFFKNRFFHKELTCVFCTTKDEMIHFFDKYIAYSKSNIANKVVNNFIEAWEDGMLFICSW